MKKRITNSKSLILLLCSLFLLMAGTSVAQTIIRVTPTGGAMPQNGSSWANAAPGSQLQNLMDAATALYNPNNPSTKTQIWVAAGTYTPTNNPVDGSIDNRDKTFLLKDGVELYGGFVGTEVTLAERNIAANPTILSGDLGTLGDNTDNTYHVIVSVGNSSSTVLDGFIVEGGNANGDMDNRVISGNNIIQSWGGGMYNSNSSPNIINNLFRNNDANGYGGALENYGSSLIITNCIFSNNNANALGGAIDNYISSSLIISNSTFVGNEAFDGNSINNEFNSSLLITNSILYTIGGSEIYNDNLTLGAVIVTNSLVKGGYTGTANIDADPLFENVAAGDFRLKLGSPAIDAGSNAAIPAGITLDISGKPRILNNTVDMGAYEYIPLPTGGNGIIYVKKGGAGNFSGDSWVNAAPELADALEAAKNLNANGNAADNITEIRVARGEYKPAYNPVQYALAATPDSRDVTFLLPNGVALYGGFTGLAETETINMRNIAANPTILSGDIGAPDVNTDNAYHVIVSIGNTSSTILDGFIVEKGYSVAAANIAMISGNIVGRSVGAGMHHAFSSPILSNNIFRENFANYGGAMVIYSSSSPSIINSVFTENTTSVRGSALYIAGSSPIISNTTFSSNYPILGSTIFNDLIQSGGPAIITNSILYGTQYGILNNNGTEGTPPIITNSLIQGGYISGTSIIDADPLFENAAAGDFRLKAGSPAINAGSNAAIPAGITLDINGNPRILNNTVDMGAYEYIYLPKGANGIIYVKQNGAGNFSGDSWVNAVAETGDALKAAGIQNMNANANDNISQIWVAAGTYYPTHNPVTGSADNRDKTFLLIDNVALYGGFAGTESNLSERLIANNPTILSGDLGVLGYSYESDNAYHVIVSVGNTSSTVLDGFIVEKGNANNNNGSIMLSGSIIKQDSGGGIYNITSSPSITNCIFTGNKAYWIGVIYNDIYSSPTITNSTFNNNAVNYFSGYFGGAICNIASSSPTITGCTFTGNKAKQGGGAIANMGVVSQYDQSPVFSIIITNNMFIGNTCDHGGGAIYNHNASSIITNSGFYNNESLSISPPNGTGNGGGAIYNRGQSSTLIVNSIFAGNKATGDSGGAISNLHSTTTNITNSVFYGNVASTKGSAIYHTNQASATITNSTFNRNNIILTGAGNGGAIVSNIGPNHNVSITNSIIYGNTQAGLPSNIAGTISPTVTYSLVEGGYSGMANIDANPLFENPAAGDFRLKPGSPAIDAGSNAAIPVGITLDINGNSRVLNNTVDMGAYEYIYFPKGANGIIYVKQNGAGDFSGSSWANAIAETGDALEAAQIQNNNANPNDNISQVWVAAGTYYPTHNPVSGSADNRDKTFLLINNVALYGGFAGTESSVTTRDIPANPTILSGNINNPLVDIDNAYHVLVSVGNTSSTILDGFIVEKGYADIFLSKTISGSYIFTDTGSGIINCNSSPVIRNSIFRENFADFGGGGMYNYESSPIIANVTFSVNSADYGGGMFNETNSSPIITNTKFIGNISSVEGGAMHNINNSSPLIANALFINNSAGYDGGAMVNDSPAKISNSTFYGNIAPAGGRGSAIADFSSSTVTNCIFYNNSADAIMTIVNGTPAIVSNSLVQGGYISGTSIIDADPLFTNAANGDFSLTACSPALNIGGALPAGLVLPATDLAGNPRVYGTTVDLGAYELQSAATELTILPATLAAGKVNTAYTTAIILGGCGGVNSFTSSGTLPAGIVLNAGTGELSGTPTNAGTFNFTVTVKQNGRIISKDYSLIISPILSNTADLSNLSASTGTLSPVFSKGTLVYTVAVSSATNSITLTPTLDDPINASVKVNGITVTSGTPSGAINLVFNDNIISIVVSAQNGTVKTYTLIVEKAIGENPLEIIETTNILSPNGDGINDTFVVTGMFPGNEVIIVDRAGREIYRKKEYDNSWDGKINGIPIQQGACYFVINPRPGSKIVTGVITIVR